MAKYQIITVEGTVLEVSIPETSTSATDTQATDTPVAKTEAIEIPVPNENTTEFELPAGEEKTQHHCSGHCGGSCNCKDHESTEKQTERLSAAAAVGFPNCPAWLIHVADLADNMMEAEETDLIRGYVAEIRVEAWTMQWTDLVKLADAFKTGDAVRCQIADEVLDRIAKQKKFAMIDAIKEVASKFLGKSAVFVTTEEIVDAIQK